ncbi:TIGR03943 family protein [Clostridium bowmanii]|uniref:TIGR03943 family putative permease subunit n=1 Tax=Clostridium bowmanii TaxID=132925 RepID=UPI001C0B3D61|nr:TIGR03943 family protein [Clostridium bowmanii]MBU3191591.1 TIGR03943 family protein [Clostridium bowmanii]MCA1072432.1 TIGR03943 family protein [Clostridium bowmanii]
MKKRLNLNELMWFLILIGFTCYFYMIISTNKLTLFVHPKMVKYVNFALYFFIVLVIFQGKNICELKKEKSFKFGYIMFLIPLFLGFLLKPEGVSVYSAINKGFSLTSQLKIDALKHKHTVLEDGTEVCEHNDENTHVVENTSDIENTSAVENNNVKLPIPIESISLIKGETINVTNENFVNTYEDLYGNTKQNIGRRLYMKGFVYKQKGLDKDEFILARILVSCCAADAQLVGVLCDFPQVKEFTEGTWVNIEGILGQREYADSKNGEISIIPIIKVNKIEKTDEQSNEYIYN